jgi:hypothetical protein
MEHVEDVGFSLNTMFIIEGITLYLNGAAMAKKKVL